MKVRKLFQGLVGVSMLMLAVYQNADAANCTSPHVAWTAQAQCGDATGTKVTSIGMGSGANATLCVDWGGQGVQFMDAYSYSSTGLRKVLCHAQASAPNAHACNGQSCGGSVTHDVYGAW